MVTSHYVHGLGYIAFYNLFLHFCLLCLPYYFFLLLLLSPSYISFFSPVSSSFSFLSFNHHQISLAICIVVIFSTLRQTNSEPSSPHCLSLLYDFILPCRSTYGRSAGRSSSQRGMSHAPSSSQRWSVKSHAPWAFRWAPPRWFASQTTGSRVTSMGSSNISMIG